jgi:multidrug efflux pump subunit AcrA (membrane-fusion protein)
MMMRRKLVLVQRFLKHFWLDKREWLLSLRGGGLFVGCVVLLALLLFVPHTATRIEATFTVEPGAKTVVRAPVGAMIRQVNVREGMHVERGTILARLESTDLEARGRLAAADHSRTLRQATRARRNGDIVSARERNAEAAEAAIRVRLLERQQDELVLTAPRGGMITTSDRVLGSALGRYLEQGDTFCEIDRLETVRLSVSALESDIEEIGAGVEVRMLAAAHPGRTLRASVREVAPVARPPQLDEGRRLDLVQRVNLVRVMVEVDNPDGRLLPGMSGRVQFMTTPRSPAGKAWRGLRRWASTVVW